MLSLKSIYSLLCYSLFMSINDISCTVQLVLVLLFTTFIKKIYTLVINYLFNNNNFVAYLVLDNLDFICKKEKQ